jgi:hypothetical protein
VASRVAMLTVSLSMLTASLRQVEISLRRHADSKVVVLESAGACVRATNTSHVSQFTYR